MAKQQPRFSGFLPLACIAILLAGGCAEEVSIRGNLPDVEELAQIEPGVSSRDDVLRLLGTPSALSTFQDRIWYYIGERQERTSFFKPEVTDRSVLTVTFDEADIVQETRLGTIEDAQDVDLVERQTPTEGRELTVLQQLFGNLGRIPGSSQP